METIRVFAWTKLIITVWVSLLIIGGAGQHNPQEAFLYAAMVMVIEVTTFIPVVMLLVIDEEVHMAMEAAPQPA